MKQERTKIRKEKKHWKGEYKRLVNNFFCLEFAFDLGMEWDHSVDFETGELDGDDKSSYKTWLEDLWEEIGDSNKWLNDR